MCANVSNEYLNFPIFEIVIQYFIYLVEQKNFSDRSALVVVVLSHGQRYDTLAARDGDYKLDDDVIFPIVRNRTLQNKPKILFVQACKGSREIGSFKTDSVQVKFIYLYI